MTSDRFKKKDENAVFEFLLDDVPSRKPLYKDAVTELFRQQLLNLLDVVIPTSKGKAMAIDGFAFLNKPGQIYHLW